MRVSACSAAGCAGNNISHTSAPRKNLISQRRIEPLVEQDYGKGLKQISYIIGISMLGIASIILGAAKGKPLNIKV